MFRAFYILLVCSVVIQVSCTERIDITTEASQPILVIYGYITTDTMQHSVQIMRSAGYFETSSPEGISNAVVSISGGSKVFDLSENDTVPGLYQTRKDVYAVMGNTYTLDVWLDFDEDGVTEHYQAIDYATTIGVIDSIKLRESVNFKNHVEVLLYAQDPPEENYYSIHVSRNDSLINYKLTQFFIMDDSWFNGMYMPGVECYFLDQEDEDDIIRLGDKITLRIDVVSKGYSTFINESSTEVRGSTPIFGGPPANVSTNIQCVEPPDAIVAAGYFSAYPSRYSSTIVDQVYPVK